MAVSQQDLVSDLPFVWADPYCRSTTAAKVTTNERFIIMRRMIPSEKPHDDRRGISPYGRRL
jgi:hypothetical protein